VLHWQVTTQAADGDADGVRGLRRTAHVQDSDTGSDDEDERREQVSTASHSLACLT